MPDSGCHTGDQDVALVGATEPVITHRRGTAGGAVVGVFGVQQLQCDSDSGEFFVHAVPVGLGKDAVMLSPSREQQLVDFVIGTVGDVIPGQVGGVGGIED